MLHTKFRGNRPAGSGAEDFESDIKTKYGRQDVIKDESKTVSLAWALLIQRRYCTIF